jgi:GTPase SAR1 family protein
VPELFQNAPNAPIILVGTKSDLKKEFEGTEKQGKIVPEADVRKN